MTRQELIALASPPCRECPAPIQRVETRWERQGIDWVPGPTFVVCATGHRVLVEPL